MKQALKKQTLLAATMLTSMAGMTSIAEAQIDTITVTAQKKSESIQTVPVAVTAFTAEDLEARNIQDVASIANVTPNLLIQPGGTGNNRSAVFIRGVGQSSTQVYLDQGVGTYVDGIYRPTAHGGLIDLLNVERIEVLRGPQGDLYGKNAIGGAISIITRQPDASETFGSITAATGSFDRIDARGFFNVPLKEDILGLQISAATRNADGFIETPLDESSDGLGSQANIAFRAALKYEASDNISWTGSVDILDQSSDGSPFHFTTIRPRGPARSSFNFQHNDAVAAGLLGATPLISADFLTGDPFTSNITGQQHFVKSKETTVVSRFDIDLGAADLVSLTSYKKLEANDGFDADGTPLDILANNRDTDAESFSQEFQVTGATFDDRLEYLFGVYYLHDDIQFNTFAENNISTIPFIGLMGADNPIRDFSTRNLTDQTLDSFAVFTNLSYALTDRLSLTFGGRFMYEEKSVLGGLTVDATSTPSFTSASDSDSWSNFSPKGRIEYSANDDVLIYASVASGFKSGGLNNQVNDDGMGGFFLIPYNEEKVWSYEAGIKADWFNNTLRTNIAAFYMDYTDLQANILEFSEISGTQIRTIVNSGSAEMYGVELESIWAPTDNFTLLANGAWLHSEYGEDVFREAGRIEFVKGDPLAYAPEFSFSVSGIYEIPLKDEKALRFRTDFAWRDLTHYEAAGELADRLEESQDAYGLLNLSLTYDSGDNWYISAFGTNVTDKLYRTGVFSSGRVGSGWDVVGRPAEWGVKVGIDF